MPLVNENPMFSGILSVDDLLENKVGGIIRMGGFNDNRDKMHALRQQAMAQQTQGVGGLAGQLGGQASQQYLMDHYKRQARSQDEFNEMMRMASNPSFDHIDKVAQARDNVRKNARDIDKAGSVREFLQAKTDDWLEDSLKIN